MRDPRCPRCKRMPFKAGNYPHRSAYCWCPPPPKETWQERLVRLTEEAERERGRRQDELRRVLAPLFASSPAYRES